MKVLIRQFLGKNHSWSVCGWGIATALKNLGHEVHLFSTDGIEHLPSDLKENLIGYVHENQNQLYGRKPDVEYDAQFSYTCMKNFPQYLSNGSKNRFGIWVYEWAGRNILPTGFAKGYTAADYLCSPSNFGKRVFIECGIPENNIKVIPHGIDVEKYKQSGTIKLPTTKKFKLFANIAQNHLRKNILGLLEAYGRAFTKNDDVCLILKAKNKPATQSFEISLSDYIKQFKQKYKNHAELILFTDFINDMSDLYRSIDATYTMSHCEGFYFPGLESLAAGKMNIAPNWGGQIDFLNTHNSLLIDGKEERANPKSMYWTQKPDAIWFKPSIDDAVNKLRYAYNNYNEINKQVEQQRELIYEQYNWITITQKFLDLSR